VPGEAGGGRKKSDELGGWPPPLEIEEIFQLLVKDALVPFTPDQLLSMDRDTVFTLYLRPANDGGGKRVLTRREVFFKHGREVLKKTELEIETDWLEHQRRAAKLRTAKAARIAFDREQRRQRALANSAGKGRKRTGG